MEEVLHFIIVVLISSVKFIGGPTIVYFNGQYEPQFGFIQANIATITGGMLGVFVFTYFSEWIHDTYWKIKHWLKKFYIKKKKQIFSEPVADIEEDVEIHYDYVESNMPKKKIFSPRSRRMVRIWKRYGLVGLAALTPLLFSIPIGTFFITRLEHNHKKIFLYMFISIVTWSLIFTSFFELTNVRNLHDIIK